MNYKLTIFRIVTLIALVVTFILNCNYNTEATNTLFNTFCGMAWGVVIYDTIRDMED